MHVYVCMWVRACVCLVFVSVRACVRTCMSAYMYLCTCMSLMCEFNYLIMRIACVMPCMHTKTWHIKPTQTLAHKQTQLRAHAYTCMRYAHVHANSHTHMIKHTQQQQHTYTPTCSLSYACTMCICVYISVYLFLYLLK